MDTTEFEKRIQEKIEAREQFVREPGPGEDTEVEATPAAAEPPPVTPETPATPETPPTPAVDEAATAAADAAEAALPEGATADEVAEARTAAEEQFYVGHYRTKDDAEEGLKAKDSTIGRLGQRLGALERELAAAKAKPAEPETPAAETAQAEELDVPAWEEWAEHQVSNGNGEQSALKALEEGGIPGYELFMSHWMGARDPETGQPDEEQRLAAMQFNNAVLLELQQVRQQPQTQETPAAAPARPSPAAEPADGDLQAAEHILEAQYPDWRQHQGRMATLIPTLPDETRAWLRAEASIGIAGRARALEYVYLAARQQAQKAQATADAAAEASADAAIVAATVTSAEATRTRTPRPEAEQRALSRRNELRKEWRLPPVEDE